MKTDFIAAEIREKIGFITLNCPQTLNAVTEKMLKDLAEQAIEYERDSKVKVIVIKGLEKSFAAGINIKELAAQYSKSFSILKDMQSSFDVLAHLSKPVIAVVSGFALGIGCEIALICDIVLASPKAQFGFPETSIGLIPCFGGCQMLTKRIGKAKAMDMILSGRALFAEEAEKAGIVSRIVDPLSLEEETIKLARRLSMLPEKTLTAAKKAVLSASEESVSFLENQLSLSFLDSPDFKNSLLAFEAQNPSKAEKA